MAQRQPIWEVYVPIYGTYIQVSGYFRTTQQNQ
jgi:hypothetical protein